MVRVVGARGWLGLVWMLASPGYAWGACSGSSPNRTAADSSRTEVAACVTAATSGDTITVPAGTSTWSTPITLPSNKDLDIIGATVVSCTGTEGSTGYSCSATNNTTLTCANGCFEFDMAASQTISGFTMTNAATQEILTCVGEASASKHFRVHHNRLVSTGGWNPTRCKSGSNGVHPSGIWDHNILEGGVAIHTNGTLHQLSESNAQHVIWAEDTPLGDSTRVVYVEANYFYMPSGGTTNFTDGNYGGRVVIRFNRTHGSTITAWEFHSPQGLNRGFQRWELYKNSSTDMDADGISCFHGIASIRGGTGVMFGNSMSGSIAGCNFDTILDNVRSTWASGDTVDGIAACAGSSAWDQNTSGQQGWHCRDQMGTAKDNSQWNHSTTPAWNQELKPAYFWDNLRSGSPVSIFIDTVERNDLHIQEERDVYFHDSTFDGTTGVGTGTIGSRPSTCTTGVAYWATDEGEWNGLQAGADGRLYKCTATNTWTLYYTPYSYPHPWTGWTAGQSSRRRKLSPL